MAVFATICVWTEDSSDEEDPVLLLGDLYRGSGSFEAAITEYKRFLFLNRDENLVSLVHARIASCYQAQGKLPEAILHHRRSVQTASSLGEVEDREFDLIAALIAGGRDREAESHLVRLREFVEVDASRVSLYLCVVYSYRGEWDKAALELERAFPTGGDAHNPRGKQIQDLERLLAEAKNTGRKSPSGAAWLSTFVPGAGQLYAGEPWDGLNALAVNAALVTLIVASVKQEWYVEGTLLFLYPFRRYYLGNRNNARLAAERRNREVDERFRRQIMDGILGLLPK
jgi:tetratricopeptide (TPR) repeat protein